MADNSSATGQASGQGQQGSGTQGQQSGQQGQQSQSLGDQLFGAQGQQQGQSGTGQGQLLEGQREGESLADYSKRVNSELTRARQEAAKYRTDLRKYQGSDEQDAEGLTEFQRLQRNQERLERELTEERNARKTERLTNSLVSALADAGAVNPSRAMRLLDTSKLQLDSSGVPTADSVAAEVRALATEMPQIFADVRGSGDGGPGNNGPGEAGDFNAQLRRRAGVG